MMDAVETVYITIGNTDNKLTQQEWSAFCEAVDSAIRDASSYIVGQWFSLPPAPFQNACWAFTRMSSPDGKAEEREKVLRQRLAILAGKYRQDAVCWAVAEVEFLSPTTYKEE